MKMHRLAVSAGLALLLASPALAKSVNWTNRTALPRGLTGHGMVDVSGTLFVIGGGDGAFTNLSASVFAYSRQTDTWTTRLPMPVPRMNFGVAAVGVTIYVMGGNTFGSSTVSCVGYNTQTDVWFPVAPLPAPVEAMGCAATPNSVFTFCGINAAVQTAATYEYSIGAGTWTTRTPNSTPRHSAAAAFAEGKIYLVGGFDQGLVLGVANVDEYDPGSHTWTARSPLLATRYLPAVAVVGGTIYVAGGTGPGPAIVGTVEILDVVRDTRRAGAPLLNARSGAAAAYHRGVLQVTGGYNPFPAGLSNNEEGWLGFAAAGAATPSSVVTGSGFQVSLTVTNMGAVTQNVTTPTLQINAGALSVTMFAGPSPVSATLIAGGVQTFVWSFTGTAGGVVSFSVTAVGTDAITGKAYADAAYIGVSVATPPQPPVILTARGGISTVNIGWAQAVAGTFPVSGYRIYRTTSTAVAYNLVGTTLWATSTYYNDTTVTNGRPYLYKVEAFDASVPPITGGQSGVLSATPVQPSGPPSNLTLKVSSNKLSLYWMIGTIGSNGLNSFEISRRTTPGTDTVIAPAHSGGATYYDDVTAVNGTTYTYWMRQRDTLGILSASSFSTTDAPRTGPFAPATLTTAPGNNQITLNWSAGGAGTFSPLSGYSVYRGVTSGNELFLAGPVYTQSFTDLTTANGSNFWYAIRSRDALGHESPNSMEQQVGASNLIVNPPTAVTAWAAADGVQVSWQTAATGDPSFVGSPAQYAIVRNTCGACAMTASVYVPSTATIWLDPVPHTGNGTRTYAVRTRTTLGFQSNDYPGVNVISPLAFPLAGSLLVSPASQNPGGTFTFTLSMTNTGGSILNLQSAALGAFRGAGLVSLTGGPSPVPGGQPIPAAMQQSVTWTYTAGGTGQIGFTVTASAVDQATGLTVWTAVSATGSIDAVVPGTPVGLTAVPGGGQVLLGWGAATAGTYPVSGYRVYRTTAVGVGPALIGTVQPAGTAYLDVTPVNGVPYLYRVEAFDSSVPPVTGAATGDLSVTPYVGPSAPTGFTMKAWGSTILVNWLPGTPGTYPVANFNVWMKVGGGSFSIASGPAASATYWSFTTAINGTAYSTYLTAQDTQGHVSPPTSTATEYPHDGPYAPATFTAVAGNQRVILTWSEGTAGTFTPISGYSLYRGVAPGAETFYAGPLFAQAYTDASVVNGTTYYYVLRARDPMSYESANSVERAVTPAATTPNPPVSVVATAITSGIAIAWTPAATGDPSTVGAPSQYAVIRTTCAACGPSGSVYVTSTTSVYVDTTPIIGGVPYIYTVRTRTTLGFESGAFDGVNVAAPVGFPLAAVVSVSPATPAPGQTVTIVVTVSNTGANIVDVQSLVLAPHHGGALVSGPTGPAPASASVPPGPPASFTWTYQAEAAGSVGFSVTITALDQGTALTSWLVLARDVAIVAPVVPTLDPSGPLVGKVGKGKLLAAPNAFRHGSGTGIRIALRGNAGGRGTVRIFDEGGGQVRELAVELNGQGTAIVAYDVTDDGGRPLAPGVYFLVAEGGGLSDRRMLAVRGKP